MLKIYLKYFLLYLIVIETQSVSINSLKSKAYEIKSKGLEICSHGIKCVPKIQCPAHVRMQQNDKPQECVLTSTGNSGYCCLTGQNHSTFIRQKRMISNFPQMQNVYVDEAIAKLNGLLNQHVAPIVGVQKPEFMHHLTFHSSAIGGLNTVGRSNDAMKQILASQIYRERHQVPVEAFLTGNVRANFHQSPLAENCPRPVHCLNLHEKYRSFDGTCNNPHRPHWGAANEPMERILPPAYEDGIWEPRRHSVDGSLLAGAREISRILLPDVYRPHHKFNLLLMQFGQFVAHDVTHSASVTLDNGEAIQCCTADGSKMLPAQSHYACMPIPIDPKDEFYKQYNQGCINFVRLSLASNHACRVGYGKQLTKVSHYLDGSVIYGSDSKTAKDLRTFRGGKLRMSKSYARDMLPIAKDRNHCQNIEKGNVCYESGDGRTNQLISLIVLHVIFAREHNRIATILSALNPHYNDEKLYQETRRIVVAELQHVIYNEFLPLIIGTATMKRFGLFPKTNLYANDYNPEINPAITNAFTGGAFRFGHSIVDGKFKVRSSNFGHEEEIEIPDVMFNPSKLLQRDFFDDMIRTLVEQPMQQFDNSISYGLSRFLFRGDNQFGLDLAALNIQRGRDQGLRTYNDYLEVAGYHRVKSFNEFHPEVAHRLSLVYKHPDDIDLWIGGLLEPSIGDGLVGPTFAEIIADQFSRFRNGDRYFYENNPKINPGHFRPEQLNAIRHVTIAGIICENIDYFPSNEVPRKAFLRADLPGNAPIRCDSSTIPRINLNLWKEL